MRYEELYVHTGQIGRYQWAVFAAVFVFIMYNVDAIHVVFFGGDMPHWCYVSELEGLPYDVQKNVAIPKEKQEDGSVEYSSCEMYAINYGVYNDSDFLSWNRSVMVTNSTEIVPCTKWTYDQSTFTSTIVSRFGLVCGLDFLNQMTSTACMFGILVGAIASGLVSEKYGRWKTMFSFCCVKLCGNALSIFSANYITFIFGRFLVGFGLNGLYLGGYVLVMELIGPKYRSGLGCALQIGFSIGFMMQPILAYFFRDDFSYQLAASAPTLAFPIVMLLFLPESPRWLTVHGKYDKALKLMRRICEVNKTELPEDFDPKKIAEDEVIKRKNCSSLLTSPTLRIRTIVIDFSWFTCSLIYYALSLNTGTLSGSIYVNTFIAGAVEVPAYIISIFLMNWKPLGRRWTGSIALTGAGISSFLCVPIILFTTNAAAATTLSTFGKAFISIAYAVVYVFASEIYPTEVRQIGMGTGDMCSRISSMVAAYVGGPLMKVWKPLPSLIFGIVGTLSGFSYLLMPETLGQPLFDTIAEAEKYDRLNENNTPSLVMTEKSSNSDDDELQPAEHVLVVS